eukprot:c23797_g1_i1.p1 GENE.c23797_g1_i1~~c23797_g1_i1.p1  ORF type:complete len:315 (+),score=75.87 c23797_g1_i1:119-1063(+)
MPATITSSTSSLLTTRSTCLLVLWVCSMISGTVPILLKKSMSANFMQLCRSFVGGVFLGGSVIHLIPEAHETLRQTRFHFADFPMAYSLSGIGLISAMFLHAAFTNTSYKAFLSPLEHNTPARRVGGLFRQHVRVQKLRNQRTFFVPVSSDEEDTPAQHSSTVPILIQVALWAQAFLEGVTIGMQPTQQSVISISVAIAVHRALASFSLAVSLISKAWTTRATLVSISLLPILVPAGALLGVFVVKSSVVVGAAASAFAGGVFLFVSLVGVVSPDVLRGDRVVGKLVVMCVGFGIMVLVAVYDRLWGDETFNNS